MSRTTSIVIACVAAAVALIALWMLVISPKRDEVAKLDAQIAKENAATDKAQALLTASKQAQADFRENYLTLTQLGKAVTPEDGMKSLMVQIQKAAGAASVDFRKIEVTTGGTAAAPAQAAPTTTQGKGAKNSAPVQTPPPGGVAGSNGIDLMPLSFSFRGTYAQLTHFFAAIEDLVTLNHKTVDITGRLLLIDSIKMQTDQKGFPQIRADITGSSYLLDPTNQNIFGESATAGSTDQTGSTSSSGQTATAPAAAIVGGQK